MVGMARCAVRAGTAESTTMVATSSLSLYAFWPVCQNHGDGGPVSHSYSDG
jgi:hypothetical protein